MTPRRWYAIATLMMLVAVPAMSAAVTNRVLNGDCEEAGSSLTAIPHWTNDRGSALPAPTARVDAIGVDNSAACVIVGPAVLRSAEVFAVTGGETLEVSADVWEIRDDIAEITCGPDPGPGSGEDCADSGHVRGDSVVALEFIDATGGAPTVPRGAQFGEPLTAPQLGAALEFHCDAYVDILENGRIDGGDSCTVDDLYVNLPLRDVSPALECTEAVNALGQLTNHECTNYDGQLGNGDPLIRDPDFVGSLRVFNDDGTVGCLCVAPVANPITVPLGSVYARVLLGGSLATDTIDPIFFGLGVSSPTSITAFDNIVVGN